MPRRARIKSESGFYHVMIRAIDRQIIFKDEEDYDKYRSVFNSYRKEYGIKLLAWCMMPNHVHLLIKDTSDSISSFFRVFGTVFVSWYNAKYNRIGHLFQDRFRSEPIESTAYLLKAIRYIHFNPVKAKICQDPAVYKYSSYAYYFQSGRYRKNDLLFGEITMEEFEKFHREKNDDNFLDIDDSFRKITDIAVNQIVNRVLGSGNILLIKDLPDEQKKSLVRILNNEGATCSQIQKCTGLPIQLIESYLSSVPL